MNQVKFLGPAHTFAAVSSSNVQNILRQFLLKKGMDTRVELKFFNVVSEVLQNNYQSHNLIGPYHFWGISPRNLFTRPFLTRRCAQAGTRP